jgi:hypothetical protein
MQCHPEVKKRDCRPSIASFKYTPNPPPGRLRAHRQASPANTVREYHFPDLPGKSFRPKIHFFEHRGTAPEKGVSCNSQRQEDRRAQSRKKGAAQINTKILAAIAIAAALGAAPAIAQTSGGTASGTAGQSSQMGQSQTQQYSGWRVFSSDG